MQGSTELMPVPDLVVRLRIPPRLDADVIIVGAGPAGTAAAVHLIRAGWRVLREAAATLSCHVAASVKAMGR